MSTSAKRLAGAAAMTGALVTYYTAPAGTKAVIKSGSIANTTAGAVSATVTLAGLTLISASPIAAGETYTCPELVNHVLNPGDTIQGLGLALTFAVSGAEIVQ